MARKYRNFVNDQNQRFIYPTSDWGLKHLLGIGKILGILNGLLPELQMLRLGN